MRRYQGDFLLALAGRGHSPFMLALGVGKAGCGPENSLDVGHGFVVVRRRPVDDDRVHLPPENVGFVEAVLGVQLRSGLGGKQDRDIAAADRRCVLGKLLHSRAENLIKNKKGARATLALSGVVGIDHVVDQAIPDELDKGAEGQQIPLRPAEIQAHGMIT